MKCFDVYQKVKPLTESGRVVVQAIKREFLKSKRTAPLAKHVRLELVKTPPCGQVIVLKIGSVDSQALPSVKDLETARDATMRAANKHRKTFKATDRAYPTEWLFFPPIVSFKLSGRMSNPKVTVTLGSENIRPNRDDLKNCSQLIVPMFKRLGIPAKNVRVTHFTN